MYKIKRWNFFCGRIFYLFCVYHNISQFLKKNVQTEIKSRKCLNFNTFTTVKRVDSSKIFVPPKKENHMDLKEWITDLCMNYSFNVLFITKNSFLQPSEKHTCAALSNPWSSNFTSSFPNIPIMPHSMCLLCWSSCWR